MTITSRAHELVECWPLQTPMMLRCRRCGHVGDREKMFDGSMRCVPHVEHDESGWDAE